MASKESGLRYKPTAEIREMHFSGLVSPARRNVMGKTHRTRELGKGRGLDPGAFQREGGGGGF